MGEVIKFPVERARRKRSTGVSPFPTAVTYLPSSSAAPDAAEHQQNMAEVRQMLRDDSESSKNRSPGLKRNRVNKYVDTDLIPSRVAEDIRENDVLSDLLSEIDKTMASLSVRDGSWRVQLAELSELILDSIAEGMDMGRSFQANQPDKGAEGPENRG